MMKTIRARLMMMPVASLVITTGGLQAAVNQTWVFEGGQWGSSDFTMAGNAGYAYDTGLLPANPNRLRLTSNQLGQAGGAWLNTTQVAPAENWTVNLRGEFTLPQTGGADGMAVVFQTQGLGVMPTYPDLSSGLSTLPTYLAINLDSFRNTDHESVNNALEVLSNTGEIGWLDLGDALEISDYFNLSTSYDSATHTLSVTFDSDARAPVTGSWIVDLGGANRFNGANSLATVGFVGATGASAENHDIMSTTIVGVPEPGSLSLVAMGGLALLYRRKTRR